MGSRDFVCNGLIVGLAACCLSLASCKKGAPDPRETFGLRDAAGSDLLPAVEEAIDVANSALAVDGRFALVPSWKARSEHPGRETVTVYFLRRSDVEADLGVAKTQARLRRYREELSKTTLEPEFENCMETDPCAALMYAKTEMARLTSEVYFSAAAVDNAATESRCHCVMLIESDLRNFQAIFGTSVTDGNPLVPLSWYVPWYALHEVGHLASDFRLAQDETWFSLYARTFAGLNDAQTEEMRADAFAAEALGDACFIQPRQEVRDAVGQACLGLAIQAMQVFAYGLFDKTEAGLRRQYLGDGATHPNALMRLLAMNLIMSKGGGEVVGLLEDFLYHRELFAVRFSQPFASK